MTILSASTEEGEGFPPFLKPSECYETGMKELVRHHSLQLSPASKELVNLEAEENRIVFQFGLLLFDGDVERARELVKECKMKEGGVDVSKSSNSASESVGDVLKNNGDASENAVSVTAHSSDVSKEAIPSNETLNENEMLTRDVTPPNETPKDDHPSNETPQNSTPASETPQNTTPANETPKNDPPPSFAKTNGSPKGRKGVLLRFHPKIRDYFDWLLEDGLDRHVVETSMREEGIDPIVEVEWGHKE